MESGTSKSSEIVSQIVAPKRSFVAFNEGVSDRSQAYLQGPRMRLSASLMAPVSSANMVRITEKLNNAEDSPPSSPEGHKGITPQPYMTLIEDTTCKECKQRFETKKDRDTHTRILHQDRVRVKRYGEGGLYETIERGKDGLFHCRCPFMNPDPQTLREHLLKECQAYQLKEPSKPIWEPIIPRRVDAFDGQVEGKRKRTQLKKFEPGQTDIAIPPRPRAPRVKNKFKVPDALLKKQKIRIGQMNKLGNAYNHIQKDQLPYGQKILSAHERFVIKQKERQESRERIRKAVLERRRLERQLEQEAQLSVTHAPEPRSTRNSKAENFKFYNTDGANSGLNGRFWNKAAGIGKIGSIDLLNDDPTIPLPWDGVSRRRQPSAVKDTVSMTRGGKLAMPNRMPSPKNGDLIVISSSEESVIAIPNDYSPDTPSETTSSEGSDFKKNVPRANRKSLTTSAKRRRVDSSEIGSTDSSIQMMMPKFSYKSAGNVKSTIAKPKKAAKVKTVKSTPLTGKMKTSKSSSLSNKIKTLKSIPSSQPGTSSKGSFRFEKVENDENVIKSILTVNHSLDGSYWSDLPLPGQRRLRRSKFDRNIESPAPIKITSNHKPKPSATGHHKIQNGNQALQNGATASETSALESIVRSSSPLSVASTIFSEVIERHGVILDTSSAPESLASSSDSGIQIIAQPESPKIMMDISSEVQVVSKSGPPIVVYDDTSEDGGNISDVPMDSAGQIRSPTTHKEIKLPGSVNPESEVDNFTSEVQMDLEMLT